MSHYNPEFFKQSASEHLTTSTLAILKENGYDELADKMMQDLSDTHHPDSSTSNPFTSGDSRGNIV